MQPPKYEGDSRNLPPQYTPQDVEKFVNSFPEEAKARFTAEDGEEYTVIRRRLGLPRKQLLIVLEKNPTMIGSGGFAEVFWVVRESDMSIYAGKSHARGETVDTSEQNYTPEYPVEQEELPEIPGITFGVEQPTPIMEWEFEAAKRLQDSKKPYFVRPVTRITFPPVPEEYDDEGELIEAEVHPNYNIGESISPDWGSFSNDIYIYEYIPGKTAYELIKDIQVEMRMILMDKISRLAQTAHALGYALSDYNPRNFIINPDTLHPTDIDLAFAQKLNTPQIYQQAMVFRDPELAPTNAELTEKTEAYAFTGLAFYLLMGMYFHDVSQSFKFEQQKDKKSNLTPLDDRLSSLMRDLWLQNENFPVFIHAADYPGLDLDRIKRDILYYTFTTILDNEDGHLQNVGQVNSFLFEVLQNVLIYDGQEDIPLMALL
jgi:hypothetical protein